MKFARIEFASEDHAAKALHGMMLRGKVSVLRDHSLIVPAPALEWLGEERIPFKLIQMLNPDDVVQARRDSVAHPV